MNTWFDNTTYPPGSRGRIEPISWYLNTGRLGISVVRRGEDVWFMICGDLGMHDYVPLHAGAASTAQTEAVEIVRTKLREQIATHPRTSAIAEKLKEDMKSLPRKKGGFKSDKETLF